jgi:ribose transport system permease protein
MQRIAKTVLFPAGMYVFFALFAWITQNKLFFTAYTVDGIFSSSVLTCTMALAIAVPLSGGRWDFAIGSTALLGGIIGCNIAIGLRANVMLLLLFCVAACVVLALIEGILYISLRIPTIIVSLGVTMLYEAGSGLVFDGKGVNLYGNDAAYVSDLLILSKAPYCYILLLFVLVLVNVVLYFTKFGYDTRSLGANAKLAIDSGVREPRNIILTYLLVGVLVGVAALLTASEGKMEPASNLSSTALMFSSMGPVLIGLFLAEYSNMSWGMLMGSIGMEVFSYGMNAFGIDGSMQTAVIGILFAGIMAYIANKNKIEAKLRDRTTKKKVSIV